MKINNNILVGVQYPKLVSYYGTLLHYSLELTIQYSELIDHELIGLVVYSPDNGINVIEKFFVIKDDVVSEITCTGNKNDNSCIWSDITPSDKTKMFETIRKQNHILDLEYYIKNN